MIKPKRMRFSGHAERKEHMTNAHTVSIGKPEGKKPLAKPGLRWKDNIKIDLQRITYEGLK
jgi:hypothetical protein